MFNVHMSVCPYPWETDSESGTRCFRKYPKDGGNALNYADAQDKCEKMGERFIAFFAGNENE